MWCNIISQSSIASVTRALIIGKEIGKGDFMEIVMSYAKTNNSGAQAIKGYKGNTMDGLRGYGMCGERSWEKLERPENQ